MPPSPVSGCRLQRADARCGAWRLCCCVGQLLRLLLRLLRLLLFLRLRLRLLLRPLLRLLLLRLLAAACCCSCCACWVTSHSGGSRHRAILAP